AQGRRVQPRAAAADGYQGEDPRLWSRRARPTQRVVGWPRSYSQRLPQGARLLWRRDRARLPRAHHMALCPARAPARDGARPLANRTEQFRQAHKLYAQLPAPPLDFIDDLTL